MSKVDKIETGNRFSIVGWHLNGLWLLSHILPYSTGIFAILARHVSNFGESASSLGKTLTNSTLIWEFVSYPVTVLSTFIYAKSAQEKRHVEILTQPDNFHEAEKITQNYGWKESFYNPDEVKESIRETERKIETIVAMFAERIAKVENFHQRYNDELAKFEETRENVAEKNARFRAEFEDMKEKMEDIDAINAEIRSLRDAQSKIKSCCDGDSAIPIVEVEKHVNNILAGYFGGEHGDVAIPVSNEHLASKIRNLFLVKNELETRIASMNATLQTNVRDVKDLADKVMTEITNQMNQNTFTRSEIVGGDGGDVWLTEYDVSQMVQRALKIYDADKTGRVDYALESSGGQIISTRCTQAYGLKTRAYKIFGYTLYYENNNARTVIQGKPIQPGNCWVFQDFPGYLLIKLRTPIRITGFTLEHAPRSTLPNGEMSSAPRKFEVLGYDDENDKDPIIFGEYEFKDSDENLQYFAVQNAISEPYEFVELRIHSNHGQIDYTCVYRFRVHGVPT